MTFEQRAPSTAEIVTQGAGWLAAADAQAFLMSNSGSQIVDVAPSPLLTLLNANLGAGEAEVIAIGWEQKLPVLIDDWDGRQAAAHILVSK